VTIRKHEKHEVREATRAIRAPSAATAAGNAHVGASSPSRFEEAAMRAQARDALVAAGWKRAIAIAAVEEAQAAGHVSSLEVLLREALRRCI
jgi:Holliday junction resolvasome RuvABC DNA-binding subunit